MIQKKNMYLWDSLSTMMLLLPSSDPQDRMNTMLLLREKMYLTHKENKSHW